MWRTRWTSGPADGVNGRVLVSITAFDAHRALDVPRIYLAGAGLRRAWPRMEGAVGLWLWGETFGKKSGSVSVWKNEEALRGFVRWDAHLKIVRTFRGRGVLRTVSWWVDAFDRRQVWAEAALRLEGLWAPGAHVHASGATK